MPQTRKSKANPGPANDGKAVAPGKRHRTPPPSLKGVKHSDQHIAKAMGAEAVRKHGN